MKIRRIFEHKICSKPLQACGAGIVPDMVEKSQQLLSKSITLKVEAFAFSKFAKKIMQNNFSVATSRILVCFAFFRNFRN